MEYRRLGTTGIEVSSICFGTSRFARKIDGSVQTTRVEAHELLDAYAELGGNFLDTAEVYGEPEGTCERWIGEWLEDRDRERFVIASKMAGPREEWKPNRSGASRKRVRSAVSGTLERLGTEYVDLYYVHWWDETTPIEETLAALDREVRKGRIHAIGLSNVAAWQLTKSLWKGTAHGVVKPTVLQSRYNAAARESMAEALDVCRTEDVAVCPYAGLAQGFLTGKYERGENDEIIAPTDSRGDLREWEQKSPKQWAVLEAVRDVATEVGATPGQVALRWLIDRPEFICIPIVASRTINQLEENMGAVDVDLSRDQRERITDAYH